MNGLSYLHMFSITHRLLAPQLILDTGFCIPSDELIISISQVGKHLHEFEEDLFVGLNS